MSDAAFIKEATEALLVEILDDDCDDLQSVRAIARTLRAAGQVIPEPVAREDFNKMSDDLTRAKNLLVRLHAKHPEARAQIEGSTGPWFIWGVDRGASPPVEVGVTVEALPDDLEFLRARVEHHTKGLQEIVDDFNAEYMLTCAASMLANRDAAERYAALSLNQPSPLVKAEALALLDSAFEAEFDLLPEDAKPLCDTFYRSLRKRLGHPVECSGKSSGAPNHGRGSIE